MKTWALFIILLCSVMPASYGQQFYITNLNDIEKVTLTSPSTYKSQIIKRKISDQFISIAIYNTTLYFNDYTSLYKGTLRNDSLVDVQKLAPVADYPTSLTVDSLGVILFAVADDLYSYKDGELAPRLLGKMPYKSAGDLVFNKGQLYMASFDGIVKVDIADPAASKLYMPNASESILGLTSVALDCKTNKIYGFRKYPTFTQMLAIDLDSKTITKVPYIFYFEVYDAGSSTETGQISGISVDSVGIIPQCSANKADISIHCSPVTQAYTYTLGDRTNATGEFSDLAPGTYSFSVASEKGCIENSSVVVPDFSLAPTATITKTDPFCENDGQISLNLNDPQFRISYLSGTFPSQHSFNNLAAGSYQFTIINNYNCTVGVISVQLKPDGPCGLIRFPTAFTPNGDGINDIFKSIESMTVKNFNLKIFNRWGTLLFTSTDVNEGWDGKYKGQDVPSGTYYWMVTYLSNNTQPLNEAGPVALIR